MSIKFIHKDDDFVGSNDSIELTTNSVELFKVLEAFERFLKGVGYSFEGHLDFVDDLSAPFEDDDVPFPLERP